MKLLFHVKSLRVRGGAERALVNLANELSRRGHDVTISIRDPRYPEHAYEIDKSVRVVWLTDKKPRFSIARVLKLTGLVQQRKLRKHLAQNDYDVVIGWLRHGCTDIGWLPRRTRAARIVAMRSRPFGKFEASSDKSEPKPILLLRHIGYGRADRVFVQMPQFRELLPKDWRPRCRVIPNSVTIPPESGVSYAGRDALVISVGRLVDGKRLDDLIRGFAGFHKAHPTWRLEIWGPDGNPSSRDTLEALIDEFGVQGSVGLMGRTDQIDAVYARTRIVVHPSKVEGMSNTVTEAMAQALPVITCGDCVGMDTLMRDGDSGVIVPGSDDPVTLATQIAGALTSLADDPAAAEQIGQRARQSVAERFAPEHIYDLWEQELQAAIRR